MPSHSRHAGSPQDGQPRRRLLTLSALLVPLLLYLPYLDKGFVSEDFLLIALHRESPPWSDLAATFGRPWLGMRLFEFYRPMAALVFGAEAALFGASSVGYNAVHLAVHLLAIVLVLAVLRALLRGPAGLGAGAAEVAAWCGALFFGLYPLAPNSVLFAASFANLFGAAATLGATFCYLRWRERATAGAGSWPLLERVPLAALTVYVFAIGCYESSIALPLWLALLELARLPRLHRRRHLGDAVLALAPFFALALAYLAFRASLFGEPLGGYGEVASRLRALDPGMAVLALRGLLRLPAPWFEAAPAPALEVLGAVAAAVAAALWVARAPANTRLLLRPLLLGAGWILVFQAPFSFQLVSPANGRYWYLASAGAAMALAALLSRAAVATSARLRGVQIAVAAIAVLALLGRNGVELRRHLGWMDRAAGTAGRIAGEIERVAANEPFFVADHPDFVRSSRGVHRAQVFHYGLRAAVGPPFRERQIDVYPLPPRADADPRRLAVRHPVFRWLDSEQRLLRLAPRAAALPRSLQIQGPGELATAVPEDRHTLRVTLPTPLPARTTSVRLIAVAPGNATVVATPAAGMGATLELPGPFARLWAELAPGAQLWWVETRDDRGRTTASSEPRWLRIAPAP